MIRISDNLAPKLPVNILLDNIRSALNVGAIFRTCDAANIHKLYLGGITPYPPHNKIPKTALGASETVDWEHVTNINSKISELREQGNKIISVEISPKSKNIYTYEFDFPSVIIFGHEIFGVSKDILNQSDMVVHLPMYGSKESLNVATTVGIVLYEVVRQFYYNA